MNNKVSFSIIVVLVIISCCYFYIKNSNNNTYKKIVAKFYLYLSYERAERINKKSGIKDIYEFLEENNENEFKNKLDIILGMRDKDRSTVTAVYLFNAILMKWIENNPKKALEYLLQKNIDLESRLVSLDKILYIYITSDLDKWILFHNNNADLCKKISNRSNINIFYKAMGEGFMFLSRSDEGWRWMDSLETKEEKISFLLGFFEETIMCDYYDDRHPEINAAIYYLNKLNSPKYENLYNELVFSEGRDAGEIPKYYKWIIRWKKNNKSEADKWINSRTNEEINILNMYIHASQA